MTQKKGKLFYLREASEFLRLVADTLGQYPEHKDLVKRINELQSNIPPEFLEENFQEENCELDWTKFVELFDLAIFLIRLVNNLFTDNDKL